MMLQILYNFFTLLLVSVVLHELGHYFTAPKRSPNIMFNIKEGLRVEATGSPFVWFYAGGVLVGMLPLFIGGMVNNIYYLLFIPYIAGCYADFKYMLLADN